MSKNKCNIPQSIDTFGEKTQNKNISSKYMTSVKKSAKDRGISIEEVIKEKNLINEAKRLDMKYCYTCLRVLDKSCFGKMSNTLDGLNTMCKECRKKSTSEHYENNKGIIKNQKIEYRKKNQEKINKRQTKYNKKKRQEDPLYKLSINLRSRVKSYLRRVGLNRRISQPTKDMIGCSPQEFREYIESKFSEGMSWDNYGPRGWHLDHIIPLASAKNINEAIKLNHYTNLQPLWAEDNCKKGCRITDTSNPTSYLLQ
jgi:hypothetical protein